MRGWFVGVVVAGCSTPASTPQPVRPSPGDDHVASVRDASASDAGERRFDWDKLRADNEEWLSTTPDKNPCDPRWTGARPPGADCLPGGSGVQIAARLMTTRAPADNHHVQLEVDRGSAATITKDWYAVILDDAGRPRKPWVHPDLVTSSSTRFTVVLPLAGSGASWKHVVLVKEVPR